MSVNQKAEPRQDLSDEERAAQIKALLNSDPPPMIQKSIETIRRDLPEMLETHRGEWVAYHGDERIGFGTSQTELVEECFRRGLTRDDFVVCGVGQGVFAPDEVIEISPDV
jgi:hypothetical protein